MPIKVTYYQPNPREDAKIVATLGLYFDQIGLYLSNCRLIRNNQGGYFVASPAEQIQKSDGSQEYKNVWWFDKTKNPNFQKQAMEAITMFIRDREAENRSKQNSGLNTQANPQSSNTGDYTQSEYGEFEGVPF